MTSNCFLATVIAVVGVTLMGCSSTPIPPASKESFTTEITQNGSKLFTFEIHTADSHSGDPEKTPDARLAEHLNRKLSETGYCKKGYLTWKKTLAKDGGTINGECREGASTEDRVKFNAV